MKGKYQNNTHSSFGFKNLFKLSLSNTGEKCLDADNNIYFGFLVKQTNGPMVLGEKSLLTPSRIKPGYLSCSPGVVQQFRGTDSTIIIR